MTAPPRRRPAARTAVLAALVLLIAALAGAPAAEAAGVGGNSAFSAAPSSHGSKTARAYFSFDLAASHGRTDRVVITNDASTTQTLRVSAATGTTAPNSGIAFTDYFRPCTGVGCWVTGLPASVTLRPHASRSLPFRTTVPAGAPDKQYLAGIVVQPAQAPETQTLGSNGAARVQAKIVHQVNLGVAVTVGRLADLRRRLVIPSMTATVEGTLPRLLVHERNTGQTFLSGKGTATCAVDGRDRRFPVSSDTVLPGDPATLIVNAQGLPTGTSLSCSVALRYGPGLVARWSGTVDVPAASKAKVVHTGDGSYSVIPPPAGMPTWAKALIGLGIAVVVLLLVVVVLLMRRRRQGGPGGGPSSGAGIDPSDDGPQDGAPEPGEPVGAGAAGAAEGD